MDACSFCGKPADECERLLAGGGQQLSGKMPLVAICNECVDLCNRILHGPHVPLPAIPREILLEAGVCPADVTEMHGRLVVSASRSREPTEAEAEHAKRLLAPFFPPNTSFQFFWPDEPPGSNTANEWLEMQIAVYNEYPGPNSGRGV